MVDLSFATSIHHCGYSFSRGLIVSNIKFLQPGAVIDKAMTCSLIILVPAICWTSMISELALIIIIAVNTVLPLQINI